MDSTFLNRILKYKTKEEIDFQSKRLLEMIENEIARRDKPNFEPNSNSESYSESISESDSENNIDNNVKVNKKKKG